MESLRNLDDAKFRCFEAGDGAETVIFVHCSSGSYKEWRFALEDYQQNFRVIAPDLLGYGANPTWPSPINPYSVDDIALLLSLIPQDRPYHLVGHSYGAVLCLEVARRLTLQGRQPASLFLIEPPAAYLLRNKSLHWSTFLKISGKCRSAVAQGYFAKAARAFMAYWIGHWAWLTAPRQQKSRIIASMGKVAYEFGLLHSNTTAFADYAILTCPITLVSGSRSPRMVATLNEGFLTHLRNARHKLIKGAGHMSPYTHPQEVKELLDRHMGWATESAKTRS
jgi:pimeloyl-ACP methyl ester carboxylesterase